ncbi:DNA-binding protein WhiA [Micrococcales bacterium 31B]|nr:DNA-binding protein WhiA [Micrococcales bacterium 31B]
MALTSSVKTELTNHSETRVCCRRAESAAMLRFAAVLTVDKHTVSLEAEFDSEAAADRLAANIQDLYKHPAHVARVAATGTRRATRHAVRVAQDAHLLARQAGLLNAHGQHVKGMPPAVIGGGAHDAEAAWRGAFLAAGTLTEPGRTSALELVCPGSEVALAMVGIARRLGVQSKTKESRGMDRVVLRDGEAISVMLGHMGAAECAQSWEQGRQRREVRAPSNRLANFDDANLRRSARAAVAAGLRVERALDILGQDIPDHLLTAGLLRVQHKQASLEELGALADPPLTKDAVAGRIRRLLNMADKRAHDLGIPATDANLSADLLDD